MNDTRFFHKTSPLRIHPTAIIGSEPEMRDHPLGAEHKGVQVELSARIGANCTVDGGYENPTYIGERVFLMKSTHIGHDVHIGPDTEIAPKCSIGGYVFIHSGVKIGQGVTIKPYVTIGPDAQIGMGSVVTKDVPAGQVWVGNPARFLCMRNPTNPLAASYSGA